MVSESDSYRPRRAFGGPEPTDPPATPPPATPAPDEDQPKPLYRDETPGADPTTPKPQPADPPTGGQRAITFVQRRPRPDDDEATTLLPRSTARRPVDEDLIDDLEDDEHRGLGKRTKMGLLVGGVAAVVVIGIAIIYAVSGVSGTPTTQNTPGTGGTSAGSTAPTAATELLNDASMITPEAAKEIDGKRTWSVDLTQRGVTSDSPAVACLGSGAPEGQPVAQQSILRTLKSSGSNAPGVLHVAQSFGTVEEATQAYAVAAKALGTCALTGDYLESGRVVTGAGDQATGSLVKTVLGSEVTGHTLLISRTGRVLDFVDASRPKNTLNIDDVGQALAVVVNAQCAAAGGACAEKISINDGPPPLGGDEPGFLSTGDLPPAGKSPAPWVATPVELPADDFSGSQCETVKWSTTAAEAKSSRIYLLQDTPGFFGLNEIVLTLKDEETAKKLVDKIKSDWTDCRKRKLTATVTTPEKVTGVAAKNADIAGWTSTVTQKTGDTTARYRVGIASSGDKVAFTFLNPQDGLDLTGDQWNGVAVRAVQRASQVS